MGLKPHTRVNCGSVVLPFKRLNWDYVLRHSEQCSGRFGLFGRSIFLGVLPHDGSEWSGGQHEAYGNQHHLPNPRGGLVATIDLSLSIQSIDPKMRKPVPAPVIHRQRWKLLGNTEALSAAWKRFYLKQGSPNPGGVRPGLTQPASCSYNARAHACILAQLDQPDRRWSIDRLHRVLAPGGHLCTCR